VEKRAFGDQGVVGRIILKWMWTGFIWLRIKSIGELL
jgi:hypothetical protein